MRDAGIVDAGEYSVHLVLPVSVLILYAFICTSGFQHILPYQRIVEVFIEYRQDRRSVYQVLDHGDLCDAVGVVREEFVCLILVDVSALDCDLSVIFYSYVVVDVSLDPVRKVVGFKCVSFELFLPLAADYLICSVQLRIVLIHYAVRVGIDDLVPCSVQIPAQGEQSYLAIDAYCSGCQRVKELRVSVFEVAINRVKDQLQGSGLDRIGMLDADTELTHLVVFIGRITQGSQMYDA